MASPEELERRERARLVRAAVEKQQRGEQPTRAELAAWKRYEAEQRERYGLAWAQQVPQRLYREWAGGRQAKQLGDHERAYGVPCTGKTISLPAVVAWLHQFLVDRREELRTSGGAAGGSLKDEHTRRTIQKLELQIQTLQARRDAELGELVPAPAIEEWLAKKAKALRTLGEWFERQQTITGPQAARELRIALEDAALEEPYGAG